MKEKITSSIIWNEAGKAGLILGGIPIACTLLSTLLVGTSKSGVAGALIASILNFIIWLVKFSGCIYMMKWAMTSLTKKYGGVTGRETFQLGIRIAMFSALICAAFTLANYLFISPEVMSEQMDAVIASYSSMLDSNTLSQMEEFKGDLPTFSFFTTLIYCFIYGWILSLILSRNIPSSNPFAQEDNGLNDNSEDGDRQ